jgi:CRISPR-associated protein Cmr4
LERLNLDLSLVNRDSLKTIPTPDKEKAACTAGSPLLVEGDRLVLEEFEFTRSENAEAVAQWIGSNAIIDGATRARLRDHLVVLHDDDFTYFVRHATEVVARIGLDYERKTVKSGALFYQEFLPAETLLYALVLASPSRKENDAKNAAAILQYLRDNLPPVLQIGGDETIGKGLCTVQLTDGKGGGT